MPDKLVRMKKGKNTFEVLVEEGTVAKYREGTIKNLSEVVAAEIVWLNASKGKRASSEQLQAAFATDDVMSILETIVQQGDSQEGESERKAKVADRRAEVVTYIAKNYIDPKTNAPIPVTRIENALVQVKARIDPVQPADRQAQALASKLMEVMPMKRGGTSLPGVVTVASKVAGAASAAMRKHATVLRENFMGGKCKFEVDVHEQDAFVAALSKATKGDFEFALDNPVSAGGAGSSDSAAAGSGKKGGKKKGKRK